MTIENSSGCDLQRHLSELESRVSQAGKSFVFEASSIPRIPDTIKTPNIEVRKTYHFINDSWRVDVLNFLASRKTYRYWGLAILAAVFRDLAEIKVSLTHPAAEIGLIVFGYPGSTTRALCSYLTKPHRFEYHQQEVAEHSWKHQRIPEEGFPDFFLVSSGPRPNSRWEDRNVVRGFGSDDASIRLAELLLNFGHDENRQLNVRLETIFSPSYRGVSRLSSEVRLHLPDSESWPS